MKIILTPIFLFLFAFSFATEPIEVKSEIKNVTVFLKGAEVIRTTTQRLVAGKQELVFQGLAEGINPQSIQATAPPDVIILEVSHEKNYLQTGAKTPRLIRLEDSLELISGQLAELNNDIAVLDLEQKMVLSNQSLKGDDAVLTAEELRKAADFFRTRLTDISNRKYNAQKKKKKLNEVIGKIRRQMQTLNYRKNQPSNDIVVKVQAKQAGTFKVRIKYYTQRAQWIPRYDLRAEKIGDPVDLDYRADIIQSTGVDWDKVLVTLSSSNPNQGGTQPYLSTWYINIMKKYGYRGDKRTKTKAAPAVAYDYEEAEAEEDADDWGDDSPDEVWDFGEATTIAEYTTVSANATSVLYKIKLPQNIPSDSKKHQVHIEKHELGAEYRHYAVPKLDRDAFLLARVTDWESLNLLPGNANIYFEGTYVGQAYLDPDLTRDTIDISLGRDPKVVITREQLKNYTKDKTIGGMRVRTFGYEITVRNTKTEEVSITLKDQIPISNNKEITVTLLEKDGDGNDINPMPTLNKTTGELTWKGELQPQETKKLKMFFEVRFPKDQNVSNLY